MFKQKKQMAVLGNDTLLSRQSESKNRLSTKFKDESEYTRTAKHGLFENARQDYIDTALSGINTEGLNDADKSLVSAKTKAAKEAAERENAWFKGNSALSGLGLMGTMINRAADKRRQAVKYGIDWSGMNYENVNNSDLEAAKVKRNQQTKAEYDRRRQTLLDKVR